MKNADATEQTALLFAELVTGDSFEEDRERVDQAIQSLVGLRFFFFGVPEGLKEKGNPPVPPGIETDLRHINGGG